MNKNVEDIKNKSIVISIQNNGKRIKVSDTVRKKIQKVLSQINLPKGYSIVTEDWRDDAVAFRRGKRPPKFTAAQAADIKNDPLSIREKACKYHTSTKTVENIMLDRYKTRD